MRSRLNALASLGLDRAKAETGVLFPARRRRNLPGGKRGDDMNLEERKRRIETMRRQFRAIHREMMDTAERVTRRLEPDHRHPEKTLW